MTWRLEICADSFCKRTTIHGGPHHSLRAAVLSSFACCSSCAGCFFLKTFVVSLPRPSWASWVPWARPVLVHDSLQQNATESWLLFENFCLTIPQNPIVWCGIELTFVSHSVQNSNVFVDLVHDPLLLQLFLHLCESTKHESRTMIDPICTLGKKRKWQISFKIHGSCTHRVSP